VIVFGGFRGSFPKATPDFVNHPLQSHPSGYYNAYAPRIVCAPACACSSPASSLSINFVGGERYFREVLATLRRRFLFIYPKLTAYPLSRNSILGIDKPPRCNCPHA